MVWRYAATPVLMAVGAGGVRGGDRARVARGEKSPGLPPWRLTEPASAALLFARASPRARGYTAISSAVLIPSATCLVCERLCVVRAPVGGLVWGLSAACAGAGLGPSA